MPFLRYQNRLLYACEAFAVFEIQLRIIPVIIVVEKGGQRFLRRHHSLILSLFCWSFGHHFDMLSLIGDYGSINGELFTFVDPETFKLRRRMRLKELLNETVTLSDQYATIRCIKSLLMVFDYAG